MWDLILITTVLSCTNSISRTSFDFSLKTSFVYSNLFSLAKTVTIRYDDNMLWEFPSLSRFQREKLPSVWDLICKLKKTGRFFSTFVGQRKRRWIQQRTRGHWYSGRRVTHSRHWNGVEVSAFASSNRNSPCRFWIDQSNVNLTQHICARIYSFRVMLRHNQTTVANKPSACKENFQSQAFDSCVEKSHHVQ